MLVVVAAVVAVVAVVATVLLLLQSPDSFISVVDLLLCCWLLEE